MTSRLNLLSNRDMLPSMETFDLTPELDAELTEALDDVKRGNVVDIEELRRELNAIRASQKDRSTTRSSS